MLFAAFRTFCGVLQTHPQPPLFYHTRLYSGETNLSGREGATGSRFYRFRDPEDHGPFRIPPSEFRLPNSQLHTPNSKFPTPPWDELRCSQLYSEVKTASLAANAAIGFFASQLHPGMSYR